MDGRLVRARRFLDTDGTSARAGAIEVDAPACRQFVVERRIMVEDSLLAGQRVGNIALTGDNMVFTTVAPKAPFAPPRALLLQGDTVNELHLPLTLEPRGSLSTWSDTDSFLLAYSSTTTFALFRVALDGTPTLISTEEPAFSVVQFGHWPGSSHLYVLDTVERVLWSYELTRGERSKLATPARLLSRCSPKEFGELVMTGLDSGIVVFPGNLPQAFDAAGRITRVVDQEQYRVCSARYVPLPTGAEMVTYETSILDGTDTGEDEWLWRPSPDRPWRVADRAGIHDQASTIDGAAVALEQHANQVFLIAHDPTRPDFPPRACATLPDTNVRAFAIDGDRGVAVAAVGKEGLNALTHLIHFTIAR